MTLWPITSTLLPQQHWDVRVRPVDPVVDSAFAAPKPCLPFDLVLAASWTRPGSACGRSVALAD